MTQDVEVKSHIENFVLMSTVEHIAGEREFPDATNGLQILLGLRQNMPKAELSDIRIIIGSELWHRAFGTIENEEVADGSLASVVDPVTRHTTLQTGKIGTIFGATVLSPVYSGASKAASPNLLALAVLGPNGDIVHAEKCYADLDRVVN